MVTGGIIYDVIVEPPSVGSTTDEQGHTRPVAFMPYRWRSLNYFLCLDLNYFLHSREELLEELKEKAVNVGANAIIGLR